MARLTTSREARSFTLGAYFSMKRSPLPLIRMPPSPRTPFGDQDAQLVNAGGMELEEFHIFQRQAAPHDHGRAVAGEGIGIGGDLPDAAMPAGGKDDRLGMEDVHLAGGQLDRNHARGGPVDHQQVNRLEFVEEGHVVLHALLVERLQDHVTGAVGGMAGAPDRFAGHVIGMPAKRALGDLAIRRAVKGQAHVFQFVDGRHGLVAHELDRILVAQVIRAFDRVVGVPFGMVFFLACRALRRCRPGRCRCANGWGRAW
jgi:hypothetical protein